MTSCWLSIICSGQQRRWGLAEDKGIEWKVDEADTAHTDHIEMSGKQISAIITYGTGARQDVVVKKQLVFPLLRTKPNDTHASLQWHVKDANDPLVSVNGKPVKGTALEFKLNGILGITSRLTNDVSLTHHIFPSTTKAALIDDCNITNNGNTSVIVTISNLYTIDTTDAEKGVYGSYMLTTETFGSGTFELKPGDDINFATVYSGRKACDQPYNYSASYEYDKRTELIDEIVANLVLETPDATINQMFDFAKLRVTESIFDTKNGLMHGPGGGAYYAAIWANDQAEYANPFFPFLGNAEGNESAINSFRLFAKYMNDAYKPIPSSIIAEGTDTWNGAGDRGDQAMIAYGASRFALAFADKAEAKELWVLIRWCLEYLRRKKTSEGVIQSDADELEGRFPAGKINLSTNTLAYGALVSASDLANALNDSSTGASLMKEALELKSNIEKYFGYTIQGFKTYRYYDGNDKLRSWIGLPLTMGILTRKEGTLAALYSPYLWTKDGMLTEAGSATYWDRALLYALRGTFYAGATDSATKYLQEYSYKRLLGEHVPYAIEAWPEGDQRHLAAESGLYCRVITEGLFGIRVTGFNTFQLQPFLPHQWQEMSLKHIRALQDDFDIQVEKKHSFYKITVLQQKGDVQEIIWDGVSPITVTLK